MFSAPGPIHRHPFATEFVGQREGGGHIHGRRGRRKIDSFGDPAVAVSLKDGLHSDMMRRSDIVGGHKQSTKVVRDL